MRINNLFHNLIVFLSILCTTIFAQDPIVNIGLANLNTDAQTFDIVYDADDDIYGFQFQVDDIITVTGVSGGDAALAGFAQSYNSSTGVVIGFSFGGLFIPTGSGILTTISYSGTLLEGEVLSIIDGTCYFAGEAGSVFDVTHGVLVELGTLPSEYQLDYLTANDNYHFEIPNDYDQYNESLRFRIDDLCGDSYYLEAVFTDDDGNAFIPTFEVESNPYIASYSSTAITPGLHCNLTVVSYGYPTRPEDCECVYSIYRYHPSVIPGNALGEGDLVHGDNVTDLETWGNVFGYFLENHFNDPILIKTYDSMDMLEIGYTDWDFNNQWYDTRDNDDVSISAHYFTGVFLDKMNEITSITLLDDFDNHGYDLRNCVETDGYLYLGVWIGVTGAHYFLNSSDIPGSAYVVYRRANDTLTPNELDIDYSFAGSVDVVAHEWAHGVSMQFGGVANGICSHYEADGDGDNPQAAALCESFSDMVGAVVEADYLGQSPTSYDWVQAEDAWEPGTGGLHRNLDDPSNSNPPAPRWIGDYYWSPTGSSHRMSSIGSKAFQLVVEGGPSLNTAWSYSVNGIGFLNAIRIMTYANAEYWDYETDYLLARATSILAAEDLVEASIIPAADVEEVRQAWNCVGVGYQSKGDVNGDGIITVSDVILIVEHIVAIQDYHGECDSEWDQAWAADLNSDYTCDILDIIVIMTIILGG